MNTVDKSLKRIRRTVVVWFVVAGLLGPFLAPLAYGSANALGNAIPSGGDLIPICTSYGVKFIPGGEGAPPPSDTSGPVCPVCYLGHPAEAGLAPDSCTIDPPTTVVGTVASHGVAHARGLAGRGAFHPRAPPVLL